jgi:hypothetical protein
MMIAWGLLMSVLPVSCVAETAVADIKLCLLLSAHVDLRKLL